MLSPELKKAPHHENERGFSYCDISTILAVLLAMLRFRASRTIKVRSSAVLASLRIRLRLAKQRKCILQFNDYLSQIKNNDIFKIMYESWLAAFVLVPFYFIFKIVRENRKITLNEAAKIAYKRTQKSSTAKSLEAAFDNDIKKIIYAYGPRLFWNCNLEYFYAKSASKKRKKFPIKMTRQDLYLLENKELRKHGIADPIYYDIMIQRWRLPELIEQIKKWDC
jgi:hypothetical protein